MSSCSTTKHFNYRTNKQGFKLSRVDNNQITKLKKEKEDIHSSETGTLSSDINQHQCNDPLAFNSGVLKKYQKDKKKSNSSIQIQDNFEIQASNLGSEKARRLAPFNSKKVHATFQLPALEILRAKAFSSLAANFDNKQPKGPTVKKKSKVVARTILATVLLMAGIIASFVLASLIGSWGLIGPASAVIGIICGALFVFFTIFGFIRWMRHLYTREENPATKEGQKKHINGKAMLITLLVIGAALSILALILLIFLLV